MWYYHHIIIEYADGIFPFKQHYLPQSCDDGYLEIIGLTSKSMVSDVFLFQLQFNSHTLSLKSHSTLTFVLLWFY